MYVCMYVCLYVRMFVCMCVYGCFTSHRPKVSFFELKLWLSIIEDYINVFLDSFKIVRWGH